MSNRNPRTPSVSAILVGWNSLHYLEDCFRSLRAQTLPLEEIVFVDNGSSDGTRDWLRKHHPDAVLVENDENVGFCVANNQGIHASTGDYVFLVNTDVVLEPRFTELVVATLEAHPEFGWGSGKLLKLRPGADPASVEEHVIDSAGEIVRRSRRALNRGDERVDCGQFDERKEVFGVTAAAAIYSRAMLEDVRLGDDFLDSEYFSYLEDCDLNWRARLRGWRCAYEPEAVAFHVRQHPKGRNVAIRRRAHFNRYLNIAKNETWWNIVLALPDLAVFELYQLLKLLKREPDVLPGIFATVPRVFRALRKRRVIQRGRVVSSREMRQWMEPEPYWWHLRRRLVYYLLRRQSGAEPPESPRRPIEFERATITLPAAACPESAPAPAVASSSR